MLSSHPVRVRTSISSLFAESCTKGQTSKAGEKVHRPVSFVRTNKKSEFDIAFFWAQLILLFFLITICRKAD